MKKLSAFILVQTFILSFFINTVFGLDYPNHVVKDISVEYGADGISITPDGEYVYVAHDLNTKKVSVVQTVDNTLVKEISVNKFSSDVAITPNGQYAYVTHRFDNLISVIKISDHAVIKEISVGNDPDRIIITPNGNYAYVSHNSFHDNIVSVIRISDNSVLTTISVDWPQGLTVSPDGDYVYVGSAGSDGVLVIKTSDNIVIDFIPVGLSSTPWPTELAITPNGEYLYVTDWSESSVYVIRTSDKTIIKTIWIGNQPAGVVVTPDGKYVYVADGGWEGSIIVIRTSDNTIVDTISVGNTPVDIAISPSGENVYVSNHQDEIVSVIAKNSSEVPTDRFEDMGDGTVRDNETNLIWLKNACSFDYLNWVEANNAAETLSSGAYGLSDGSSNGDWRLPTKSELQGLGTDPQATWYSRYPSVAWKTPGAPFISVKTWELYWSSTPNGSSEIWCLDMVDGYTYSHLKASKANMWLVHIISEGNCTNITGDIDNDGEVTLADAILALRISAGMTVTGVHVNLCGSVRTSPQIGPRESIYILQQVSGLR